MNIGHYKNFRFSVLLMNLSLHCIRILSEPQNSNSSWPFTTKPAIESFSKFSYLINNFSASSQPMIKTPPRVLLTVCIAASGSTYFIHQQLPNVSRLLSFGRVVTDWFYFKTSLWLIGATIPPCLESTVPPKIFSTLPFSMHCTFSDCNLFFSFNNLFLSWISRARRRRRNIFSLSGSEIALTVPAIHTCSSRCIIFFCLLIQLCCKVDPQPRLN